MKSLKSMIVTSAFAGTLFANNAVASDFTVEDLHRASIAATETFKNEFGAELHKEIYGIQVTKGRDSGKVKLFYRENNTAKNIEFFCHYHDADEIDCH